MLRSSNTDEYLTWNLSNLYRGILTVYSKYPEIEGSVRWRLRPMAMIGTGYLRNGDHQARN